MSKPHVAIIATSNDKMGDTGDRTGFHYEELATPYLAFTQAGYNVTFASPKGGNPPADPASLADNPDDQPESVRRFLADEDALAALENSTELGVLEPDGFDAVYLPGGHGTMWDFPENSVLAKFVSAVYENGGVVGAVCHGPAGLVGAKLSDGEPLVKNRAVNSFTDEEERRIGKDKVVPFLLETKLRELGARFEGSAPFERHVVRDGRLVTGQNPASAQAVADGMIAAIHALQKAA